MLDANGDSCLMEIVLGVAPTDVGFHSTMRGGNCARQESWNNADITTFARKNAINMPSKLGGIMAISPPKARDAPWGSAPRGIPRFCRGYCHYSPRFSGIFCIFPCKGRNIVTLALNVVVLST